MNVFTQTRSNTDNQIKKIDFQEAILNPSAPLGGLYTLENIPKINFEEFTDLQYNELTEAIFSELGFSLDRDVLKQALHSYENFDNPKNPAPLVQIKENLYSQELYHGPTRAFKDMALQPFGVIFSNLAKKKNKKYLILAATSGDTGPATLQSFANQDNICVVCLYPKGGTSDVQELQMITQNAKNLKIFGINGNFDDAQSTLKNLLSDEDFKTKLEKKSIYLSAANSVNFGRIAFQIIYHIWGYLNLVKNTQIKFGEEIYIIIPSGNFGNALGAFYAKKMGLPIKKIIISSNPNNILTEFIQTGIYNIKDKTLIKSYSPAMDILKSSNVERVLFALFGSKRTYELMNNLEQYFSYELLPDELEKLQTYFSATFCSDRECLEYIKKSFDMGYLLDPHTATTLKGVDEFCKNTPTVICSTAEWTKFAPNVIEAIFSKRLNDKEAITFMCEQKQLKIPDSIKNLFSKPIIHSQILQQNNIKSEILKWLDK
ncbi:threonine synthase [Helicobacter cappadocius]|uniref:Threonine synthase n=1 Tax=Helicobacter cappadocius TaxID=3063998 RepID=A0AA90TEV0_9HELI|nr:MULTISPECIES: threonine synthase [unclassified Helicobacter]MDO7253026.1 threonine synthase [Helicobacter sp. faydin-H75]MDP2538985.1 threonine synthase [Helicobacter sp. faydin-H76]